MPTTDAARVAATADVYRLLSACFYQPEAAFEEEDLFGQLAAALESCAPKLADLARQMGSRFSATGNDELLLDYTRLFLGPYEIKAKPYGSCYLDGEKVVMGDSTVAARNAYRQAGFEPGEDFREMPDHVAVELEHLYLLHFRKAAALAANDAEQAAESDRQIASFLDEHLGSWAPEFAGRIQTHAESDFYRLLGELLEAFVAQQKG